MKELLKSILYAILYIMVLIASKENMPLLAEWREAIMCGIKMLPH
jgi:hypothetical protein